ncbi:hypothetical protein K438DRAFT_1965325 [Mycena galopus ATCC 62051]|nr:hypothetical protein K438DRAFT_1965325 [Mycena galopus ATCC 62051]
MPPTRTNDARPIASPTPRAFTFPITHNLSDSPYSSPSHSPFEPDLRALALSSSSSSPSSSCPSSSSASSSSSYDECPPRTPPPALPLPLSAFTRTLSPVPVSVAPPLPSAWTSPPPPSSPSRRKGSATSTMLEERRPKKGEDDYVKRPENAFILFRRKYCKTRAEPAAFSASPPSPSSASPLLPSAEVKVESGTGGATGKKQRQADLSKTISQQWKALSPEERAKWEELAKEKKREHEKLHPGYVYRPQRAAGRKNSAVPAPAPTPSTSTVVPAAAPLPSTTTTAAPARRKPSAPPQQIEFIVATPRHARSASAPHQSHPHQQIHVPNVYAPVPAPYPPSNDESGYAGDSSSAPFFAPVAQDEFTSSNDFSPSSSFSPEAEGAFSLTRYGLEIGNDGFDFMPSSGASFAGFDFESTDYLRAMFPPLPPPSTSVEDVAWATSAFSCTFPDSTAGSYSPSSPLDTYGPLDPTTSSYDPVGVDAASEYSMSSSLWAATSPWGSATTAGAPAQPTLMDGDFDIGRIPEVGWDLGSGFTSPAPEGGYDGELELVYPGEMEMEF